MHALIIGRRLSLIALAISTAVVIAAVSGAGLAVPGLGPVILASAGVVPGLAAGALVLLASPPPRTGWSVHIAITALVSGAIVVAALANAAWSAHVKATEARIEPGLFAQASEALLPLGLVLIAGAVGLLLAQLLPARASTWYVVLAIGPAVLVILLLLLPTTTGTMGELAIAASNIALGTIFISPFAAVSAYVVATDKIRKLQKRAAA